MRNEHSLSHVAATRQDGAMGRPLYGSYCFSQLPSLLRSVLIEGATTQMPATVLQGLPARYKKVVFFLIDGFGWDQLARFADQLPFLRRFAERGVVSQITSQFPATTSAHVTTIHTGAPVAESGVIEWWYYEPLLGQLFAPLLFSQKVDEQTLRLDGPADAFFPQRTLYQDLAAAGVRSCCFQHRSYAHSPYSLCVTRGARSLAFKTIPEALINLTEALAAEPGPGYFFAYFDGVDSLSHQYGPRSRQVEAEILALFQLMEQFFHQNMTGADDTLVVLTADHGQSTVSSPDAIYLDERLPELRGWLRVNPAGQRILPAGGPRDVLLYIEDRHLAEAEQALAQALRGVAVVHRTSELLAQGLFGAAPSERLKARAGDLLLLPGGDTLLGWAGAAQSRLHYKGHHGGLAADELEIPLLTMAY